MNRTCGILACGLGLMHGKATRVRVMTALIAAVGTVTLASAAAWSQDPQWSFAINQEFRYFSWEGTRGFPPGLAPRRGSGHQFYAPVTVSATGTQPDVWKFEFVGRGGYVSSKQTTPDARGSVATVTDTVAAATWTYLGIAGMQPYFALNANIPTGKAVLSDTEFFARMDPDLVALGTFGEGWNYGPTIGVNLALAENVILSLGGGYTVRETYDIGIPVPQDVMFRLDPGDVATANVSLGFRRGALTVQIAGGYSHESGTSYDGVASFQLGDRYFVSGSGRYSWSDTSVSSLVASWNHYQKNRILNPPPMLVIEDFNSNSNVFRARFEHAFTSGNWSAGPIVSYLMRDENAYSPITMQFVPAKTRWSAGGSLRYKVNDKTLLYGSVEHVWVQENSRPAASPGAPIPDLSYTGWVVVGGGSFRF